MLGRLLRAIIPAKFVVTMSEINIFFMKDCCPLERRTCTDNSLIMYGAMDCLLTMKPLACRTVAILRIQRLLPTQLILDSATVTTSFIQGVKAIRILVNSVGCSKLPFIKVTFNILFTTPFSSSSFLFILTGRHVVYGM